MSLISEFSFQSYNLQEIKKKIYTSVMLTDKRKKNQGITVIINNIF